MKRQSPKKKIEFKEGTWFAIPLEQGGYAVGRVARRTRKGEIILAYFFGPRRDSVPTVDELEKLSPQSTIKIARVGTMGIFEGSWPIIGESPKWERQKWAVPQFIRNDKISKSSWRVVYDEDDPNLVISDERIPYDSTGYAEDGLFGSEAAEMLLSDLLA